MLVLFVLTIVLLHGRMRTIEEERKATQAQLDKITEVEEATRKINPKYFEYKPEYKKHILKISVLFDVGSSDINNIDTITQGDLKNAGEDIRKLILENAKHGIQYLLIIEGQASKDNFLHNYELSYERALALKKFWEQRGVNFGKNCEVLISGSGDGRFSGTDFMRESDEKNNQRFLIHIVPKYGTLDTKK